MGRRNVVTPRDMEKKKSLYIWEYLLLYILTRGMYRESSIHITYLDILSTVYFYKITCHFFEDNNFCDNEL